MSDMVITVQTRYSLSGHDVIGADTTILTVPPELTVGDAIALPYAGRFLRRLAEEQAAAIGEALHHAEFVVTRDKAEIEARNMHDCEECRAATRAAFRMIDADPGLVLLVGQLYWAQR